MKTVSDCFVITYRFILTLFENGTNFSKIRETVRSFVV